MIEPDLFQVMNKFAIRHHREDQLRIYDPIFLDWIFWWFLAALETSNRLVARNPEAGGATTA